MLLLLIPSHPPPSHRSAAAPIGPISLFVSPIPIREGSPYLSINGGGLYDVGQGVIVNDNSTRASDVNSGNITTNNVIGSYNSRIVTDNSHHTYDVRRQYYPANCTYNQRLHPPPRHPDTNQAYSHRHHQDRQIWDVEMNNIDVFDDSEGVWEDEEQENVGGYIEERRFLPPQHGGVRENGRGGRQAGIKHQGNRTPRGFTALLSPIDNRWESCSNIWEEQTPRETHSRAGPGREQRHDCYCRSARPANTSSPSTSTSGSGRFKSNNPFGKMLSNNVQR